MQKGFFHLITFETVEQYLSNKKFDRPGQEKEKKSSSIGTLFTRTDSF